MKSSPAFDITFCGSPYEQKAGKKDLKLDLAFISIDNQLKELAESKGINQVRLSVPNIRSQLFDVYNLADGLDIKKFACGCKQEC